MALLVLGAVPIVAAAEEPSVEVDVGFSCQGDPPRQTVDPLSPPCVAQWNGDNGGSTAPGVDGDEVRILIALDGGINYSSGSDPTNRAAPTNAIYDLGQSEEDCRATSSNSRGCSHLTVRGLRVWQEYFDLRFQTYDRSVRYFVAFSEGSGATAERRRAEANLHVSEVDPFAVVPFYTEGHVDAYVDAVARHGRMVFQDQGLASEARLAALGGLVWDFQPSAEVHAANFGSLVCQQVANRPPTHAGPTTGDPFEPLFPLGAPRRLGLVWTTDPAARHLWTAADVVREAVEGCAEIVVEATHGSCCVARDNGDLPDESLDGMSRMRQQGVTTVLWAGGFNSNMTDAATAIGFTPEWVLMGDGVLDNATAAFYGVTAPQFHDRASVLTYRTLEPAREDQLCHRLFREVDLAFPSADLAYVCDFYRALWLTSVAIQVAGPTLDDVHVAAGLQALPEREGTAEVPGGSFHGDHTFVGDGHLMRFDGMGQRPGSEAPTGCWRSIDGAARHEAGGWPDRDIAAVWSPDDVCNGFSESTRLNLV